MRYFRLGRSCRDELHFDGHDAVATGTSTQRDALETGWSVSSDAFRHVELLEIYAQTSVYASRGLILVPVERGGEYSRVGYFAFTSCRHPYFENASVKTVNIV
jgi:hypothetical protein